MFTLRAPPPLSSAWSLFLDLDGTLAAIEPRPQDVGPLKRRTTVLEGLASTLSGAVAVLTGRSLDDADRILEDSVAAVAAVHGLVRRSADGTLIRFKPAAELVRAKAALAPLAKERDLLVEDKTFSIAVHYRQAPDAGPAVRSAAAQIAMATGLILQEGSMVSELRTVGPTKGDALSAFLAEPPFAGRTPVMVGDDLTDEHAFVAAEAAGGFGILVGPDRETAARFRLASVEDVLAWLEDVR